MVLDFGKAWPFESCASKILYELVSNSRLVVSVWIFFERRMSCFHRSTGMADMAAFIADIGT